MRTNGKWLMILGVCAALLYVESDQAVFAHGTPHVIPLVTPESNSIQQGFIRIVNRTNLPGEVSIYAIDDTGERFGPVFLSLNAKATVHLNSGDLERGNPAKGLSSGVGDGEGNWWLELDSELDIEPLGYIRTGAGFVTSMHDVVADVGGCEKPRENGEHKILGLTSGDDVLSQIGRPVAGSSLPAMNTRCVRTLRRVTRRAGAQRRSREEA